MHKKIITLIIVVLFIVTVFNGAIIGKEKNSRIKIIKDFINVRNKLEKLNINEVKNCIKTEDYDYLLEFMGNNSKIVKNAHINASGKGIHFGKPIYILGRKHPFPRFKKFSFPFSIITQWFILIRYCDEKASTYIEPKSGDPFYINGSHSIIVSIWIFPITYKIHLVQKFLKFISNDTINISIPWYIDKWHGKTFTPWEIRGKNNIIPWGVIEGLYFIFRPLPLKFQTSVIGIFKNLSINGSTPFVIYKTF